MTSAAERGGPVAARGAAPFLLERARLNARLDEAFGRTLTVVVAGAGYGKTTMLARWTADLEAAWYTATADDRVLPTFAAGVAESLRGYADVASDEFRGALAGAHGELERAEVLAGFVSEALEAALEHDVVLVIDDAQALDGSDGSLRFIEALCRTTPPTVHLVLASRAELDLRLTRLSGQGQVALVAAEELAFTEDEVRELVRASLEADDALVRTLYEVTGGWPAATRLALDAVRPLPPSARPLALDQVRRPGAQLFSYLANEVLGRESREVRELIRATASLDRFSVELGNALGLHRVEASVQGLLSRGLVVRSGAEWLSLHSLVREFARSAWPLAQDEQRALHARAASWYESLGRFDEALAAFAAAGDDDGLARVLETHGNALLASGASATLLEFARRLPRERRSTTVEEHVGAALIQRGELSAALEHLHRAADVERLEPRLAARIASAHYLSGDLDDVVEICARTQFDGEDPAAEAALLAWSGAAASRQGDFDRGRELAERAMASAEESGEPGALAATRVTTALIRQLEHGPRAVIAELRAATTLAERAGEAFTLVRGRTSLGVALTETGEYRDAVAVLDEAVRVADTAGMTVLLSAALLNRGRARFRLGWLDEARADYEAAVALSRDSGSYESYALRGLGDVHRERGDVAPARAAYERSLAAAENARDVQGVATARSGLAKVLLDDDPERAVELATSAVSYRTTDHAWALNALGWVRLARGEPEQARAAAAEAAATARAGGDAYALAEALELTALAAPDPHAGRASLNDAVAIWRQVGNPIRIAVAELALARLSSGPEAHSAAQRAERRIRALGVRVSATGPAGALRAVARASPAPLAIETLGGFRVLRDGVPILRDEWPSRKARDLLKILVARRGRATARELLMETLWPGDDPARLGNRLSVALSTLRSLLDPDRRHAPEHFIGGDRTRVALSLERVVVDVEVFLHEAEAGLSLLAAGGREQALERLEQAETAYAGEFLEEDPYEEWATALREECRATYIEVAHALAAGRVGEDDDASARYLLRILTHDAYDERAHLQLVEALERLGRRGEARRAYRRYVVRMEELGVVPAAFPAPA